MEFTNFFALKNDMANSFVGVMANSWGISVSTLVFILLVVVVWELVWKLAGMWKAAKKNSPIWFVIIAVFNTVGILPILYIYVFSKMKSEKVKTTRIKPSRRPKRRRR
jgi:nitrogen fixation/metabolism regulation signal transduction histidine kinase